MKQSRAPSSLLLMFPRAHSSGQLGSRLQSGPMTQLEEHACPNTPAFGSILALWEAQVGLEGPAKQGVLCKIHVDPQVI